MDGSSQSKQIRASGSFSSHDCKQCKIKANNLASEKAQLVICIDAYLIKSKKRTSYLVYIYLLLYNEFRSYTHAQPFIYIVCVSLVWYRPLGKTVSYFHQQEMDTESTSWMVHSLLFYRLMLIIMCGFNLIFFPLMGWDHNLPTICTRGCKLGGHGCC